MPVPDPFTIGPWPHGVDNRTADPLLPRSALRESVNLDIDKDGALHLRAGYALRLAQTGARSLFAHGDALWFAVGNELRRWVPGAAASSTARSDLHTTNDLASVQVNNRTYYSDGVTTGIIDEASVLRPWGVPNPPASPSLSRQAGGLPAGIYRVALTQLALIGQPNVIEESGTSEIVAITVPDDSAIQLSGIQFSPQASAINVYVTAPNGSVLMYQGTVLAGSTYTISMPPHGRPCETMFMVPFPASEVLDEFLGRILGASGNLLWASQPLRYGLVHPVSDFLQFPDPITLIAGQTEGAFVCTTQRTYWMGGRNIAEWVAVERLPVGAVKGTLHRDAISRDTYWMSPLGVVKGGPGGGITLPTEKRYTPGVYARGAAAMVEIDGRRHLINSLTQQQSSSFAVSDYAEAEVIRRT